MVVSGRARRFQGGIALILVLWVLSLLTVIALSLTVSQRGQSALAHNQVDAARFRALADGAVHLAVLNLLAEPIMAVADDALWRPDGTAQRVELRGEILELRIFNEASRIDLNQIQTDQLTRLLELAGAAPEGVESLAAAILDWRDPSPFNRLHGADAAAYSDAGHAFGPANQPFQTPLELLLVPGMTRELYRALAPDLGDSAMAEGVQNRRMIGGGMRGAGPFDPEFASARALAAMQGMSLEEAERRVDERAQPVIAGAAVPWSRQRGGPLYRIRVRAWRGPGAQRALEVLVRVSRGGPTPFEILWRREGLPATPLDPPPDDFGP